MLLKEVHISLHQQVLLLHSFVHQHYSSQILNQKNSLFMMELSTVNTETVDRILDFLMWIMRKHNKLILQPLLQDTPIKEVFPPYHYFPKLVTNRLIFRPPCAIDGV